MSVVPAEDLLRAVAGAAKLKRLWLRVAQLLKPVRTCCANLQSQIGRDPAPI